jgi:hypothetical protein
LALVEENITTIAALARPINEANFVDGPAVCQAGEIPDSGQFPSVLSAGVAGVTETAVMWRALWRTAWLRFAARLLLPLRLSSRPRNVRI